MKQRLTALLLALLLTLSACAGGTEKQPEDEALQTGQETAEPEETAEEAEEAEEEPSEPERETLDYSAIAMEDASDVYELTALPQLAGTDIQDAALVGEGQVLLLTGDGGNEVLLLDLETGTLELLCQLEETQTETEAQAETKAAQTEEDDPEGEEGWSSVSFLCAEPVIVSKWDDAGNRCLRIALDGSVTGLPSPEENDWLDYYQAVYADDVFYAYQSSSGVVYQVDYDTGEYSAAGQIPADYLYLRLVGSGGEGAQLIFQGETTDGENEVTLVMECSDGSISAVYGGWEASQTLLDGTQLELGYPEREQTANTITAWASDEQVVLSFELSWLDRDGSTDAANDGWLELCGSCGSWGRALFRAWDGQQYRLLLWDYSAQERQAAPITLTEYVPPEYEESELTRRAQAMEETYGVRIYVGEAVTAAPFPDYTVAASEDLQAMSDALDVLEKALAEYPEGYLDQLGGDTVRELCFYLTGTMTPIDPSANIADPGGLSCQVDSLELIAFNVDYIRVQDVIHELTHVLDHWLWAEGTLDEEIWSSLNPEGFDYYYAYIDGSGESYETAGSTAYTTWDEAWYNGDADSVYFIDPYSTTYPTEDRARLMEYLLANSWGTPDSYFSSEHLQAKLSYYFLCIRSTFDTEGWPEQTSWEQALAGAASAAEE